MTQATLNRRRALAVVAAVPVAAVVGLPMTAKADPRDDRLLARVRQYEAECDELSALCKERDMDDEELDERIDRAHEILMQAVGVPTLTAAGALAALDLVTREMDDDFPMDFPFTRAMRSLVESVRGYIASTTGGQS